MTDSGASGTVWWGDFVSVSAIKDYKIYVLSKSTPDGLVPPTTVAVTGVTLNKTSATLTVGGTETLTPTVAPGDATDKSVSWSSDNTAVATVADGVVTAVAAGTANITVTTTDGSKTATCAVTVNKAPGAAAVPAHMQWEIPDSGELAASCHSDEYHVNLVEGQEYVLALHGAAPDWSTARELDENDVVIFTGLSPATEYDIWSRAKETANTLPGEPALFRYTASLLGMSCMDEIAVGNTVTVVPDPEDIEGLSYEWRVATEDEDGVIHIEDTPIAGEIGASYTIPAELAGKYLNVTALKNGVAVGDMYLGPVLIPAVWTAEPEPLAQTYNGAAQALVSAGTAEGCTVLYALGAGSAEENEPDYEAFNAAIPTGTDAGTYYVWYMAEGDASHTTVFPACVTATISKADITPSVTITGWTYGGTANAPSVTGNTGSGEVTYTYARKDSTDFAAAVPTEAGEYTVKAMVAATANYNGGEATADFAISDSVKYEQTGITGTTEEAGVNGQAADTWHKGSTTDVTITVKDVEGQDNSFEHHIGVELDGKALILGVDYNRRTGSTIIELLPATLQKLSVGQHTVKILFDNGSVDVKLTVKTARGTTPATGDVRHTTLWITLAGAAVFGLGALELTKKKRTVQD